MAKDKTTIPSVLKRNQACHQCRRRKLKCDAQRPCATCVRSHANAIQTALPGAVIPERPECTYDELPESQRDREPIPERTNSAGDGGIRSRYAQLEHRIGELENELQAKDKIIRTHVARSQPPLLPTLPTNPYGPPNLQLHPGLVQHPFISPTDTFRTTGAAAYPTPFTPVNPAAGPSALPLNGGDTHFYDPYAPLNPHPAPLGSPQDPLGYVGATGLMYNNWPPRLPTPDLLRHLIQTFFVSHPHASRLLHRPTFMASLDHAPSHPNFPALSLLHAICALSSIWSPLVEQENMPDLRTRPAEEIFQERERQRLRDERARHGYGPQMGDHRGEWFGEMHARWSREEEERGAADGVGVFQGLQSIVVLTWYYYSHARWVEVWLYTAKAMRYAVPMGLNVTSTHGPLLRSWAMPSILGPPKDHIEEEMRRNTFWLAYCYERWQAASTGWAMALDDEDISQVLSCRMSDFENGIRVSTDWRQRISTPRMLTLHMPEHTDSFALYVKGTVLFSKVKNFNSRFKSKYFYAVASTSVNGERFTVGPGPPRPLSDPLQQAKGPSPDISPIVHLGTGGIPGDDPSLAATTKLHISSSSYPPTAVGNPPPGPHGAYASPSTQGPERIDPRDTPSFRAVDNLIEGFRTSFPKDLRDPVRGGRVDSELYVACLVPHVATILLHDPHADPSSPFCKSSEKLLFASRQILDLVYILCSTSFDVTLLDPVASFAWFLAARVLVRFLKAKIEARKHAEAVGLRNELEVIRLALKRVGERIPLGFRQAKMLDDLLINEVGNSLDDYGTHSFAVMTNAGSTSPGSEPHSTSPNLSHRDSLSAQGQPMQPTPTMAARASISSQGQPMMGLGPSPGASLPVQGHVKRLRGSFSVQGDQTPAPQQQQPLPQRSSPPSLMAQGPELGTFGGSGVTRGLSVSELIQRGIGVVPGGSVGAADVHLRFVDGLSAPDEGHPGLEMLLADMIDDGTLGENDGYGNLVGFTSLGGGGLGLPMNGIGIGLPMLTTAGAPQEGMYGLSASHGY